MAYRLKRLIINYFGSTKNFIIWVFALISTIYIIDNYLLTGNHIDAYIKKDLYNSIQPSISPVTKEPLITPPKGVLSKCDVKCPSGQFSYIARSGDGRNGAPYFCFNGNSPPQESHRGLHIVVVNASSQKIIDSRFFDTYIEDSAFIRYMKMTIPDKALILLGSQDEIAYNLKDDSKSWLQNFGSGMIDRIKFRDGFVMVGQRGLTRGSAIEQISIRGNNEFATPVTIKGCLSVPMGKLNAVKIELPHVVNRDSLKIGEESKHCGIKNGCSHDQIAVHLSTGKGNTEGPKICVNGKYVLATGLNEAGRGFNIAIFDPSSKEVIRVGHFDTYAEDSSNLEIFLEMMKDKEIVLIATHDDASKNLNEHAKKLLETLGSSYVRKISFRDTIVFVGQKGIVGHSPIEEIKFAGPSSGWPDTIDTRMCIPTLIKGSKIKSDPLANKNEKKRKFCGKYDGYGEFCNNENVDDPLTPAPFLNKNSELEAITQIPIIVIPGLNHNALRMQLETLLLQPGIHKDMVTIMYDEKFDEAAALSELFGFKQEKLSSSTKYVYQMEKSLELVFKRFTDSKYAIILEEELILAPDFLFYLAQILPILDADNTLAGASAWNENGYDGVSTNPNLAYRVDTFPGLGLLLKRSFYEQHMRGHMKECCLYRSWDRWFDGTLPLGMETLVPDVSRVYRRPYEGLSEQADFLSDLYNRKRVTNINTKAIITSQYLSSKEYESQLQSIMKSASIIDVSNAQDCIENKGLGFYIPESRRQNLLIFFEQSSKTDYRLLKLLCRCFRLFYSKEYSPRGLHNGLLRFTMKNNSILLVGSQSHYTSYRPENQKIITLSLLPKS